jgi:hypothetical protein
MGFVLPSKVRHDETTAPSVASSLGDDDGDQLGPARGIAFGFALGAIFLAAVGGLFWLLRY